MPAPTVSCSKRSTTTAIGTWSARFRSRGSSRSAKACEVALDVPAEERHPGEELEVGGQVKPLNRRLLASLEIPVRALGTTPGMLIDRIPGCFAARVH